LTADSAAENNAACMAAGANMFLTKPVLANDLTDALKELKNQVTTVHGAKTRPIKARA
jgi:CheY-like chemotaxis protein